MTATPAATSIVWQKYINSQPVTIDMNNNRYTGGTTTNPSLTISSVTQDDQSQYICQAINSVGTGTSNQVYLTVTGGRFIITYFCFRLKMKCICFIKHKDRMMVVKGYGKMAICFLYVERT